MGKKIGINVLEGGENGTCKRSYKCNLRMARIADEFRHSAPRSQHPCPSNSSSVDTPPISHSRRLVRHATYPLIKISGMDEPGNPRCRESHVSEYLAQELPARVCSRGLPEQYRLRLTSILFSLGPRRRAGYENRAQLYMNSRDPQEKAQYYKMMKDYVSFARKNQLTPIPAMKEA